MGDKISKPVFRARLSKGASAAEVDDHFTRAAQHYDRMNDILSGGLHLGWKQAMLGWLEAPKQQSPYYLLDLAGGSGDLTRDFLSRHTSARAVLADPNLAMQAQAREKLQAEALVARTGFVSADGQALPFAARKFHACLLGFGLRNMAHREQALAEIYRVLRIGGRFLCLEFTPKPAPFLVPLYDFYRTRIIAEIGALVAGEKKAYAYLARSIGAFPPPEQIAAAMREAGFVRVQTRLFSGGVAALFSGWRF